MLLPLFHVDAFTDRPFAGNPAAVCLLHSWKEDRWLQAVAREMNLSETAFLVKQPDHFDLRWFTPTVRSGPVRPRHAGVGAHPLAAGSDHRRRNPLLDPERHPKGHSPGPQPRTGLPFEARRSGASASRPS